MTDALWRITFPIEKAEQTSDGVFITGLASGPEIDSTGERMDKALIHRFADQINSTGGMPLTNRLVYRDAHAPDGVLRDLGWLTKAWVTDAGQLGVEVQLDEENPAAMYLFRAIRRGKQYGMSVAGKVIDFVDEFVADVGKTIRTYRDVVLTEISNTTRPAWTPSFGSVLSKAIDEAAEAESLQEKTLMSEELKQETTEAPAADTEKADEQLDDAAFAAAAEAETEKSDEAEATEETEKADESASESEDEDVEKAGRKFSATAANKLLGMYAEIGNTLKELGLLEADTASNEPAEKADSDDEGDTLAKAAEGTDELSALREKVEELVKSNSELTAKVQELESKGTVVPPVIERADAKPEDFEKALSELTPAARLRVAMAAHTGGK